MAWPADNYPITVEYALDPDLAADPSTWAWTAFPTAHVRPGLTIQRGRPDARSTVEPTRLSFALNNDDSRYTPRHPSALSPAWGRDTPIRVRRGGSTRCLVFISAIRLRWPAGNSGKCVAEIEAAGILRRVQQGQTPLRSALTRAHLASAPVAYWPCEDGSGASRLAPGVVGAPEMRYAGTISIGVEGPAGASAAVGLSTDTQMHAYVPTYTDTGEWTVSNVLEIPAAGLASETVVLAWSTLGSLYVWRLILTPGSPDTLSLVAYTPPGVVIINHSTTFVAELLGEPYGRPVRFWCRAEQSGADIDYEFGYGFDGADGAVTGTATTQTLGTVTTVAAYPSSNLDGSTVGHFAVWDRLVDPIESAGLADAVDGYDGEVAYLRRSRLGYEEDIRTYHAGTADNDTFMGPQRPGSWLDLVRETEAITGGVLYEPRAAGSYLLQVREAASLYNQAPALELSYANGDLSIPFEPVDDDQQIVNDFEASRPDGSTSRYIETAGPNSTAAGAVYDSSGTFNVHTDEQLPQLAAWQVHLGTVDDQRYPVLVLNFRASPHLVTDWIACDIGSRITVSGGLEQQVPGGLDLMLQGYREYHDVLEWTAEVTCSPYLPYHIFTLAEATGDTDPFIGHLDITSCVLAEALDTTETGVDVTTTPLWTTTADDLPFDIIVGGERMTVTAVTGASNPQTLTVARSVNGVAKSHSIGATVEMHPESATYLGL